MKANEVMRLLKISRVTLSKYVKNWKLKVKRHFENWIYDYDENDVYNLMWKTNRKDVIYARVSTSKQKEDLKNQVDTLIKFCNKNWIQVWEIYEDISSWMNFERKQLKVLIDEVVNFKVRRIFVTYKDRFSRIWFRMFKELFENFWCEIVVLNDVDNKEWYEKEVFWEIISMLDSFSMKMYSKRRQDKLNLISKDLENYEEND